MNSYFKSFCLKGAFSRLDPTGEFSKSGPKKLPIGRFGKPEELSNLAAYTVSDYSNWLTGEIIVFDGGELVNKVIIESIVIIKM